jgi:acyl-CoA synthetase (AMP-forming)/AMP-acid ligase II
MSYLNSFLQLSHRYFFENLDLQALACTCRSQLGQMDLNGKWIYLSHHDPVQFAILFLEILDRGGAPICLTGSAGVHLDSWAIIDGHWKQTQNYKKKNDQEALYAVPTSGTTGSPKICEFSLKNGLEMARVHAQGFNMEPELEIVQTLPIHHSYGITAYILTPLQVRCSVNFCQGLVGLRRFNKDKNPRKNIMHVSPSQARFIIRDKVHCNPLKKVTIGGGSISLFEVQKLQSLLPQSEVYVSYGLTEAGPRVSAGKYYEGFIKDFSLSGSETWIGAALETVEVRINGQTGENSGRLCVKTPYRKLNPQDGEIDGQWILTRDRVQMHGQEIFFLSREDDLLKYGGITIYPRDIEFIARTWPNVQDAIVLKENDFLYGDRPILFLEGDIDMQSAQELLIRDIYLQSAFQEIHVLDKFPRQSLEKIDRKCLLEIARSRRNDSV